MKSRFSPSPTGLMHLGNVRTALFNVLVAEKGVFLLRIEDSDRERSKQEYTDGLLRDLTWLGLDWQDGPYYQSQRNDIYEKYYQQLIDTQRAYSCFCTELELTLSRKTQVSSGKAPRYNGKCRNLTPEQVDQFRQNGLTEALRFNVGEKTKIEFVDLVQGPKVFQADDIGDFIIKKGDGSSSFMFCNAIDDSLMGVTHALRGEDHLTNTPRQLLILDALGLTRPQYGHIPLIVGHDGKPLSKRNGSQSIEDLRHQGYFSLALVNYLARLGHHYNVDEDRKLLSLKELTHYFEIGHIGRSPAHYDETQLHHWQKEVIQTLSDAELWAWMQPLVEKWVPEHQKDLFVETVKANIVMPKDALFWAEVFFGQHDTQEEAKNCLLNTETSYFEAAKQGISTHGADYKKVIDQIKTLTNLKGKNLFMPLRAVLTGVCFGPELEKIFLLMGKDKLLAKLGNSL